MYINWARNELNLRIVYYGPALSGKTTNLIHVHSHVDPSRRSELVSLKTSEDRTIYFDFLQVDLGRIGGMLPRLQFYTVPGQPRYQISRKLVLRGSDGVVFVADSRGSKLWENLHSWREMWRHLEQHRLARPDFPVLLQWNKTDLPDSVPSTEFRHLIGYHARWPYFQSVAVRCVGVYETLQTIVKWSMQRVQYELAQVASAG